ncbi:hypothetical protein Tco_0484416 [Tanacetum coccineum]
MTFISIAFDSRYPPTDNQLRILSNPRNQATIQDGRVIVQNVQGRLTQGYAGSGRTQPKRPKNSEWFKEKMLLAQAQEAWVILDEEQLAFLADTWDIVDSGPDTQTLPTTAIFQTDDLDAFDSDCDEAPLASAVLMAKLSAYDSDVLSEVPNYNTYQDINVIDQRVQEM